MAILRPGTGIEVRDLPKRHRAHGAATDRAPRAARLGDVLIEAVRHAPRAGPPHDHGGRRARAGPPFPHPHHRRDARGPRRRRFARTGCRTAGGRTGRAGGADRHRWRLRTTLRRDRRRRSPGPRRSRGKHSGRTARRLRRPRRLRRRGRHRRPALDAGLARGRTRRPGPRRVRLRPGRARLRGAAGPRGVAPHAGDRGHHLFRWQRPGPGHATDRPRPGRWTLAHDRRHRGGLRGSRGGPAAGRPSATRPTSPHASPGPTSP